MRILYNSLKLHLETMFQIQVMLPEVMMTPSKYIDLCFHGIVSEKMYINN